MTDQLEQVDHDPDEIPADSMKFLVPYRHADRHTTAQMPEGERAAGQVCVRLWDPTGTLVVHEHRVDVDEDGILVLPMPADAQPGEWTLARGPLVRSMTLVPKADEAER